MKSRQRSQRSIQRRKIVGIRLHNVVEDVTMEQEQHARNHRRKHPKKKHESGGVVAYEEGRQRQRRVRVSRTHEGQPHGGRKSQRHLLRGSRKARHVQRSR